MVSRAEAPTVSVAKATSWPNSSPRREETGLREYLSSGAPWGRPRWEITTTRAPASTSRVRVGRAARIRPSSVIVEPSSGTLRSARTSTRLPRSSPSESMVFSTMVPSVRGRTEPAGRRPCGWRAAGSGAVLLVRATRRGSEGLAGEQRELDQTVGEAPLVVVPGEHLHHVAVDLRQLPVDDRGVRVTLDVLGHDRVLGVPQDALEGALGGLLQRGVDLLGGDLAGSLEHEVGDRAGGDRHAQRRSEERRV